MCASLRFLSASESEQQSPAELPSAPALAQVWQVPLGVRGTPCAPGGHAGRAASRPRPDRGALGDPSEKRKAGPAGPARARCAHPARTRRAPARLTTCSPRVFRRADGTPLRRAKCLTSEPVLLDSGLVAVCSSRLGDVCAQSQPVYNRDEKRSLFLAADQWNNAFSSL